MEQDNPKINEKTLFELKMTGGRHAAEVYEQTGSLEHALMGVSQDWYYHAPLRKVWDRDLAREANGGVLPKASDYEQDDKNQGIACSKP